MAPKTNNVFRSVDGKVQKVPVDLPALGPNEVLIKITHSGLCHSDHIYLDSGFVLGHEGVGIIEELGSAVTSLNIGDRVGGGYLRSSCGKCKYCLTGNDIWCYQRDIFGESNTHNGTFADYYIGTETYVYKIPDNLSSADAAPLQCAGATVYSAMVGLVKPGDRVGVLGIGGLGHLAIQFASKLGAEVVVFSTTPKKESEAREFGAKEFYLLHEPEKMAKPVDILVMTGSQYPDFSKFFTKEVFARQGTILPLTAPETGVLTLPSVQMFFDGYNVHSSLVASRYDHEVMLKFAAANDIRPLIEEFKFNEAGWEEAVESLVSGKVRYRAVLSLE